MATQLIVQVVANKCNEKCAYFLTIQVATSGSPVKYYLHVFFLLAINPPVSHVTH